MAAPSFTRHARIEPLLCPQFSRRHWGFKSKASRWAPLAQCNSCPSTHRSCWTCGRVPCALLRQGGVLTFQCHRKSVEWVPSERAASAPCTGRCHPGHRLLLLHHCCWTHHRGHSALSSRLPRRHSHGTASEPPRCCASVTPVHCPGWGHPIGREFRENMYLAFYPCVVGCGCLWKWKIIWFICADEEGSQRNMVKLQEPTSIIKYVHVRT